MITKTQEEFLWGALIGGAIGAATALMLTPVSGSSLRRQVANGLNHLNGHGLQRKATAIKDKLVKAVTKSAPAKKAKPKKAAAKKPAKSKAHHAAAHHNSHHAQA